MAQNKAKLNKFLTGAVTATMVATAVVPVAAAASFTDTSNLDAKVKAEVDKAVELGFFKDGEKFNPSNKINRSQAALTLARYVAGGNDTAALKAYVEAKNLESSVTAFKDVPASYKTGNESQQELYYASLIVKNAGAFTQDNLNPTGNITRSQMAKVIVESLGLTKAEGYVSNITDIANLDAATKNYIETLASQKVTNVTTFNPAGDVTRSQMASFLVRANDAVKAEVEVVSVKAINAKTIEVTFNKAVDTDKAKIEVKRGSVKPSVKEIKFSEDKKSAKIEFNTNMLAGDYTVTVTGLSDKELTGTVKVEAEKLTSIEFLSDVAVINGNDIKLNVQAKNQYGEIINDKLVVPTNTNISVTASKGSTGHTIDKDGLLTVKGAAGDFKADDKVVVTIVDSATGVTATKTVTVAKAAQVDSIVLGELKTDDEELAKKPVNVTNMGTEFAKYYIPVTLKDQYGNTLKAADLAGVNVLSSNEKIVKVATTQIVDLPKVGTVIKLQAPDATATHGTAVLTVVSAGTGKTASVSVKVLENAKTDTLTVSAPETALKEGVKTELPFAAADQYGNALVSSSDLGLQSGNGTTKLTFADGSSITATGANLEYSIDYGDKNKVKLHVTPTAKNVVLTAVSATGKAQTLNLTAEAAPEAASLGGLSKDVYTAIQKGQAQTINLDDVIIKDQYGEDIALTAGLNLTFKAVDETLDAVTLSATTLNTVTTSTIATAATKGTEGIEISLVDVANSKTLDTITVNFETVELKDITEFGIKEIGKLYSGTAFKYGNASADYDKTLEIFGKKGTTQVFVDQALLVSTTSTTPIVATGTAITQSANQVATNGADKTATLTGLIAGANDPITVTQTVTYNDAQSVISELKVRKTSGAKAEIKDGAVVVPLASIDGKKLGPVGADSTFQFYAKDQYGVEAKNLSYTVTNLKSSTATGITIATDGTITVAGGLTAGDSFTVTAIVDGVVKSIKVIVGA